MSNLDDRIQAFENKYLARLESWTELVDPGELETLIATLGMLDEESKALSETLKTGSPELFRTRWEPLLKRMMDMVPAIQGHLEAIRDQSRQNLGILDKGQRGLMGYRSSVSRKSGIFDKDA